MPSRKQKLSVYLTEDEYQNIKASAQRAGLSFSRFAKMVCLGMPIKSLEAKQSVLELIHFRADLGRLGGLLKMWLANKDNSAIDARRVLREIEARQEEMKRAIKNLERI